MSVSVSASGQFLGLRRDGTIVIWPNRSSEDLPEGLSNVVAVAASSWYHLALVGPPLRLTPAWRDGAFHLSCPGFSGWNYLLEYKESLLAPAWNVLGTLSGNTFTRDWTTNNPPQGFYRVRRE